MKILTHPTTNEIWYAVRDVDWFYFQHTTNITLTESEIDEVAPDNKDLCLALYNHNHFATDAAGQRKFYVSIFDPLEITERDGWTDNSMEVM